METTMADVPCRWEELAAGVVGRKPPHPVSDDVYTVVIDHDAELVKAVMAWIAERRMEARPFHRVEVETAHYETRYWVEHAGLTFTNPVDAMICRLTFCRLTDEDGADH